ncbi:MAG: FAD-dependent oxidoreductase [Chitinophagaceae bacterium]
MSRPINIINHLLVPVLEETDILVIGGGSAGCLSALGARCNGTYKVSLLERYGFLGGTSTQMLDTFYGFFNPGKAAKKIVGGLPDTIVNELNNTGDVFLRPNTYGAGTGVNYNPERLKLVWDNMLMKAGVNVYLHTTLVDVRVEAHYSECIVWHKSGFFKIRAKRIIDASGDADYCKLAGIPFELAGENEPAQSMTTTFRMCGVDLNKFEAEGGKKMLQKKMKDAISNSSYALPRAEGSAHEMCQPGCVSTVAVKVSGKNALDVVQMTEAESEGRRQSFIYEDFFRTEVPGYENAKIIALSNQIGVRETRRVYGEYRLTKQDCLTGAIPPDSVFLCGAPIEDHRKGTNGEDETFWQYIPQSGVYGVPYGTLVPISSTNVWVVGRCFSATHDAHASCRSMAQTMSMGQAAGIAASLSLEKDQSAAAVNIGLLQERLRGLGAVLEVPAINADTSRGGWTKNIIP